MKMKTRQSKRKMGTWTFRRMKGALKEIVGRKSLGLHDVADHLTNETESEKRVNIPTGTT